jgi:hypothetical protein
VNTGGSDRSRGGGNGLRSVDELQFELPSNLLGNLSASVLSTPGGPLTLKTAVLKLSSQLSTIYADFFTVPAALLSVFVFHSIPPEIWIKRHKDFRVGR